MSAAAPRTAQAAPEMRQLGYAIVALILALTLVVVVAFSRQTTTQFAGTPAAGSAPIAHDHGWSTAPAIGTAPVTFDRGWATAPSRGSIQYTGIPYSPSRSNSTGGSHGTGGSNGTRFPQ